MKRKKGKGGEEKEEERKEKGNIQNEILGEGKRRRRGNR